MEQGHYPCVDYHELPNLICAINEFSAVTELGRKALLFSILTATRAKAARLIKWDQINFDNNTSDIKRRTVNELATSWGTIDSIEINDVELNSKILNLVYQPNESKICSRAENYDSDDEGIIYLTRPNNQTIYQIFIYFSFFCY